MIKAKDMKKSQRVSTYFSFNYSVIFCKCHFLYDINNKCDKCSLSTSWSGVLTDISGPQDLLLTSTVSLST